ncbi:MAG TPA: Xaa-Pro peptidase family protein [Trueperaceae bacterium]|nr:Xaa-Pro peptidase family protein [Trueperaceae bacterium]
MSLIEDVRGKLAGLGADALLVTAPANVRYLSGFTSPDDGVVLITGDRAALLSDGRYTAQAAEESRLEVIIAPSWEERLAELVGGRRLAVESEHLSLQRFRRLSDRLGTEPLATEGFLTSFRLIKTDEEIANLREAARITDEAFEHVVPMLRPGVREIEVALELERHMRLAGSDGPGFHIIVASGTRSAMPHGVASTKTIESGDLVTMDFGAVYRGYHADMTRAVAVGPIAPELRRLFDAVAEAQDAAMAAVGPGRSGRDLDAIARDLLAGHDLAEAFSHSLGHGTGLEIHEGPRLSHRSQDLLAPGMIVTVEPGVYLPGFGGVRIEDLAAVTEDGCEVLSNSPKGFRQV